MNDVVRKANNLKFTKKKNRNNKKNEVLKLSTGNMRWAKPKLELSSKGSFVQEFKKIRNEIEKELKEDMKNKSRVFTACASPKSILKSTVVKSEIDHCQEPEHGEVKLNRK